MRAWIGPVPRRPARRAINSPICWTSASSAAAAAAQDALFAACQALASVALQDLTLWAQQLPQLIRYTRPRPPAALTLDYRLYQDATRASELAALNDAPHPLFMPTQR